MYTFTLIVFHAFNIKKILVNVKLQKCLMRIGIRTQFWLLLKKFRDGLSEVLPKL